MAKYDQFEALKAANAADAVPNPRPQRVYGAMNISEIEAARRAILNAPEHLSKEARVFKDYLGMVLDAARHNGGKLVEMDGKVY